MIMQGDKAKYEKKLARLTSLLARFWKLEQEWQKVSGFCVHLDFHEIEKDIGRLQTQITRAEWRKPSKGAT